MLSFFFDAILDIVSSILQGLAPKQRSHYVWYIIASTLVILACSSCILIAKLVIESKRYPIL
jgi:hypothetical protein